MILKKKKYAEYNFFFSFFLAFVYFGVKCELHYNMYGQVIIIWDSTTSDLGNEGSLV